MVTASRQTKVEIGLVVVGALLVGGGSVLLRLQLPEFQLPYNLRQFQYSLGFLMLGLLLLVAWKAEESSVRKASLFLSFAVIVALGMPPESDLLGLATNVVFALSVVLLGAIYFEFSRGKPSLRPLVGALWLVMLTHFLYGEGYLYLAVQRTQNLQLALGMIALLLIFLGFSSMLWREWQRANTMFESGYHE